MGNCADIAHKNSNCDKQIANGHEENDNGGELGDAVNAAGDDKKQQGGGDGFSRCDAVGGAFARALVDNGFGIGYKKGARMLSSG
ncbi:MULTISPECIES: hypothetical protein [unclassified Oscillibacter]|uniref:hypothetical protein n=1 Tax=unclassified Oscillibacter TaxID=2629304 RepID=UPI0025F3067E|nr:MULTISPECIES: hypothetical protein [unclassified Oscillibacter]